jgi:hypothetical protein
LVVYGLDTNALDNSVSFTFVDARDNVVNRECGPCDSRKMV